MVNQLFKNIKIDRSKYSTFEYFVIYYIPLVVVSGFIGFSVVVGIRTGQYSGVFLPILLLILYFCALQFSVWYLKRKKISYKLTKWIAWSNLISWFLPPLGFFTGICTVQFGLHFSEDRKKYSELGGVGMILACINSIGGIIIRIHAGS